MKISFFEVLPSLKMSVQQYVSWNTEWHHVLFTKMNLSLLFILILNVDRCGRDPEHEFNCTMCSLSTLTSSTLFCSKHGCVLMAILPCTFAQATWMSQCNKMQSLCQLWNCFMLLLDMHSIFFMTVQPITMPGVCFRSWKVMGLIHYSCHWGLKTLLLLSTFGTLYRDIWITINVKNFVPSMPCKCQDVIWQPGYWDPEVWIFSEFKILFYYSALFALIAQEIIR